MQSTSTHNMKYRTRRLTTSSPNNNTNDDNKLHLGLHEHEDEDEHADNTNKSIVISQLQKVEKRNKTSDKIRNTEYNNHNHDHIPSTLSPSFEQKEIFEDYKFQILFCVCIMFCIFQSRAFRFTSMTSSGYSSPYYTMNQNPTYCPIAKCYNSPRCQPCQRRFLIIIATGRSGSTTLMNLLDALPNVRMAGENKGALINDFTSYFDLYESKEFDLQTKEHNGVDGAWKHFPIPDQSLACPIQKRYEAINPPPEMNLNFRGSYDDSETVIGFKTVRLHDTLVSENDVTQWTHFLIENFPCAKFVVNIRGDVESQKASWLQAFGTELDGESIRKYTRRLTKLAASLGQDRARILDMSDWSKEDGSGLGVLNDLVEWLGFRGCKFSSLIHSNKDGYEQDVETSISLGKDCHLKR